MMVDRYGLNRGIAGRSLIALVAALVVLAALGIAGAVAAGSLSNQWRQGAGSVEIVEVPRPAERLDGGTRAERALHWLQAQPGIVSAHLLTQNDLHDLLKPWLGDDAGALGLALPAIIEVHVNPAQIQPGGDVAAALAQHVPGVVGETSREWTVRLLELSRSLAACASAALLLVISITVALIALAVSAGLTASRDTIAILHLLGAEDGDIAQRFAMRMAGLALVGGLIGVVVAIPVLVELAQLAAPFGLAPPQQVAGQALSSLTLLAPSLWISLVLLPAAVAAIGWVTAQVTVLLWLRRMA